MQKFSFWAFALLASVLIIPACKHTDDDAIKGFGSIEIEFDNQANGSSLVFGKDYTNAAGETL